MTAAAEEATDILKHSYATTVTGIQDYNTKVLEFTNANIKGAVEQATKLISVKTPTEFFTRSPTIMQIGNLKYLRGRRRNLLRSFGK